MKKRTFLYIPALILFIFALSAMVVHFSRMVERQRTMTTDVRMPFNYNNGRVLSLLPEGERLGIKVGDRITAINGRELTDTLVWREELAKGKRSGKSVDGADDGERADRIDRRGRAARQGREDSRLLRDAGRGTSQPRTRDRAQSSGTAFSAGTARPEGFDYIGASLMMASLQASLRGQSIHCGSDLAELMKHVNTLVYEASTSNRYATFFYAQLGTKTRKLIYVNAGHNPPFVLRANGDVLRLEEGGAVVGMLPTMFVNYTQGEMQLEAGDLLVGFTDGISEAMNPAEEEWGEDAMLAELKTVCDKCSEEILNHIVECADRFADGAKQHDDMTTIIVKII